MGTKKVGQLISFVMNKPIYVTQPFMPPMEEFVSYLDKIWKSRQLTNNGQFHIALEQELCDFLGVKYISLFANGTLALITALQALNIKGEVITTPFSFVATTHALWWNGIKPVFTDIDPVTMNMDPEKIEKAITPNTSAILPVHVYGSPCDHQRIQAIANKHNLKVIYDAAHAFGVRQNGVSVVNYGHLSVLSFHATKVFSTIEGGAIICHDQQTKQHIDDLKNFGFRNEITVVAPGINAKMNEFQAAYGLLSLKYFNKAILKRADIAKIYYDSLADIPGITLLTRAPDVQHNFAYYPIFINQEIYKTSRDDLYEELKTYDIFCRRYFYPLISNLTTYKDLNTADPENLPVANKAADTVLCLPIYPDLNNETVVKISEIIRSKQKK